MIASYKKTLIAAAAIGALAAGGGAAIAASNGGKEHDPGEGHPVHGKPLQKASAIALQQAGGGRVTGTELRDEEGYYEIEVTRADGSQVDVHLDRHFNVLDAQSDGSGGDEGAGGSDEGSAGR